MSIGRYPLRLNVEEGTSVDEGETSANSGEFEIKSEILLKIQILLAEEFHASFY